MASGDPMMTPLQEPPELPAPLSSSAMGSAQQQQSEELRSLMQQPPRQPPARRRDATAVDVPIEVKNAFAVCLIAFVVLIPNVQQFLQQRVTLMHNPTTATVINAALVAAGYYFFQDQVVSMIG